MKLSLSSRDRRTILLVGLLGMLTLWAYLTQLLGPMAKEVGSLGHEVRSAREQLKILELATSNEDALRQQHQQVNETVESLRRLLPAEQEIPTVIERLSDMAGQSGVKIQAIFPQRQVEPQAPGSLGAPAASSSKPVVFTEIPIQIDALAGYHQLGTFLSLVESADKPMQVSSLRMSGNQKEPKRHIVKLVLRAYFAALQGSAF